MENIKMLIVVDMQNDFITGSLGSEAAQSIVANVAAKIEEYKKLPNNLIVYTQDTHYKDTYLQTQEGHNLPVEHCLLGTEGWELCDEVKRALTGGRYYTQMKETFGSLELAECIQDIYRKNNFDGLEIELCGLCSDICVVSNALLIKAAVPEVVVTVDARCTAGVSEESHKAALLVMKTCQVNVIGE